MKRTEDDRTRQRKSSGLKGVAEESGVLWKEADGTQVNSFESCGRTLIEDGLPRWISGIISEFHTPGARCIAKLHRSVLL
jgi:hypothetical protein